MVILHGTFHKFFTSSPCFYTKISLIAYFINYYNREEVIVKEYFYINYIHCD